MGGRFSHSTPTALGMWLGISKGGFCTVRRPRTYIYASCYSNQRIQASVYVPDTPPVGPSGVTWGVLRCPTRSSVLCVQNGVIVAYRPSAVTAPETTADNNYRCEERMLPLNSISALQKHSVLS